MTFNPDIHDRKSIRLKGYDYSKSGFYTLTLCSQNKAFLFGEIFENKMLLNEAGRMIEKYWLEIPKFYPIFDIDEFQIMPNHFHGIIEIKKRDELKIEMTLSDVVSRFKSLTTKKYIEGVNKNQWLPFKGKLWQRNFYEHIIRDRQDYLNAVDYIKNNPSKWQEDEYNSKLH